MGQRQSRKSVDITPTPKKNAAPVDGAAEGVPEKSPSESVDRKYEKIEDPDTKPASNGLVPHAESTEDKDKDEATEKVRWRRTEIGRKIYRFGGSKNVIEMEIFS